MKSIFSLAAVLLLGASQVTAREYPAKALEYRQYKTLVYKGCYSDNGDLTKDDSYEFQSKGYCQQQCVPKKQAVQATSNSDECWCGMELPAASAKVDDSKCTSNCTGYGPEMCGGDGFFSVYLTGTSNNVGTSGSSSETTTSSISKASPTTSATPSVVTIGGQTVIVTAPASSSTDVPAKKGSGGGPNKAAIAAGVVVGIVVVAAIAGGLFLFLRNKRRRAVEEEYRRNAAVSSFIGGGKPPTSSGGASSFNDTRLDPSVMAQRRMSDGSIADNQDYSRRILKVTNA